MTTEGWFWIELAQAQKAEQVVQDFEQILDERQQEGMSSVPATKPRCRTA